MSKRALITGITGQDGSYLTELLFKKGYEVYGMVRRASQFNRGNIEHIFISHTHFDHIVDLPFVIESYFECRKKPLKVYALSESIHKLQEHIFNWSIWPDFQNIDAELLDGGSILYLEEWRASAIAFADSEDGQEKCKIVLGEVSDDVENQREAAKVLDDADRLVNEARSFAEQVRSELEDIDKSWSSRKENKFQTLMKTCPGCKELF